MMESYFIEDNITTIIISNGNDRVIVYQTPINNENVIYEKLKSLPAGMTELSLESQNSILPVIKAILGIIKVVKTVVETIKMVDIILVRLCVLRCQKKYQIFFNKM